MMMIGIKYAIGIKNWNSNLEREICFGNKYEIHTDLPVGKVSAF